ncbi:MAG: DUF3857 domain-containing protein, partial [Deltaproteobacteria bacterium]|nr:DUF3857 domain-containing protein [Deltaproteobacteria bacterium]
PAAADPAAADPAALSERFFAARTAAELLAALEALRAAAPDAAARWEAEALYAALSLDPRAAPSAALRAVERAAGDEALAMFDLSITGWLPSEVGALSARLLRVAQGHPSASMRAAAAWSLRHSAHYRDDATAYALAVEALGPLLPLSVIGTWDNDQGKGLDQPFPPERGVDLAGRYPGKLKEVAWRSEYPLDLRGKLNLDELLSPKSWQVAYGAAAFRAAAGPAELRLSTSDPVKVWVNGELALSLSRLDGWLFDGVVIPLHLREGVNQVLIKSGQQTDTWILAARLTAPGGAPLAHTPVPADTPAAPPTPGAPPTVAGVMGPAEVTAALAARLALPPAGARREALLLSALGELGLELERLERAEAALAAHPDSLLLRIELTEALWARGERGRAADLLAVLHRDLGRDLPLTTLLQARFWSQQHLDLKARAALRDLLAARPDLSDAAVQLAALYKDLGWTAERCALLERAAASGPRTQALLASLAECAADLGDPSLERERRDALDRSSPLHPDVLARRFQRARAALDVEGMLAAARAQVAAWPQRGRGYRDLAAAERAARRLDAALAALDAAAALDPLDARPLALRGEWLAAEGREAEAVAAWQGALELDPENQGLRLRLSELRGSAGELWLRDVPSEADIEAAVAARAGVTPAEGANVVNLLDDEVVMLNPDGSTTAVITAVTHALNQEGRDELTKLHISRAKSTQLMAAYAISPSGTRVEAASIRDGVVRFRQLEVGATVVLQYRYSTRPSAYLTGSLSRFWWFHSTDSQVRDSRMVLWLPKGTPLHESPSAPPPGGAGWAARAVERDERVEGDLRRVAWRMRDLPPLVSEPRMPPSRDVAYGLEVSTVPSWEDMWTWERELLREAFRVSPEVERVADEVVRGAQTAQERALKIHEYVIHKIRYQQDYEQAISGVKPHDAAQVLSRQYGDCKDKAVLFITLARRAGLKAHFALVKTRDSGKVDLKVPSQQFNHAIVYVPAQEGLPEGRFFDPTVDTLDVESLRSDDQGTTSLVYDPDRDAHYWQEIPFQGPEHDSTADDIDLTLLPSGAAEGTLTLTGRGSIGQILRQRARNPEAFKQVLQYRLHQLFPGAELLEHEALKVESLFEPAVARVRFRLDGWAKVEGQQVRLPNLIDWSPSAYFHLDERRFPVNMGTHREWTWRARVRLPSGLSVAHLPPDRDVRAPCLTLSRASRLGAAGEVEVEWRYASLCEEVSLEEYALHQAKAREMTQALKQEVVLSPSPATESSPTAAPAPAPASLPA